MVPHIDYKDRKVTKQMTERNETISCFLFLLPVFSFL